MFLEKYAQCHLAHVAVLIVGAMVNVLYKFATLIVKGDVLQIALVYLYVVQVKPVMGDRD
jgi:hypothetical protein